MLDDSLGEPLAAVAGGENAEDVRYRLVGWLWVDHPKRLRPFLVEAVEYRPSSLELRSLLAQVAA